MVQVGILASLSIDVEVDAAMRRMTDLGGRIYRADYGSVIEVLADIPGSAAVF